MSYTNLTYHIIIRTHHSEMVLTEEYCRDLYAYIYGIFKKLNCFVHRINGTENHIHILFSAPASFELSSCIKILKTSTNAWLKSNINFPRFYAWGAKYAAFTIGRTELEMVKNYIANQKEHHKKIKFEDEYLQLIQEQGIIIDEKYWLKEEKNEF